MTTTGSHIISIRTYVVTYVALLALASLSLVLSNLPDTTALVLALVIATVKALLVLLYFMHLSQERFSFRFIMLVSSLLVSVLIVLTVLDPVTRANPVGPSENPSYRASAGEEVP